MRLLEAMEHIYIYFEVYDTIALVRAAFNP